MEAECELGTAGQRVRPGCSVHSELARAGRPSPVPGGRRRKSGGSPWLGVGSLSRQGPLLPRATDDAERAAASAGNAAAPGPEGLGGPGRGWAGLQGAPEGLLARAWVRGEAGAGNSSPKGQIACCCQRGRLLLPSPSCRVSGPDYNSRGAPRRHAPPLAPSHPHPRQSWTAAARAGGRSVGCRGGGRRPARQRRRGLSPPGSLGSPWTLLGHTDRVSRVTRADPSPLR